MSMIRPGLAFLPNAAGQAAPQIVQGEISNNPASFDDDLQVIQPFWNRGLYFTIPAGQWSACHGRTLPQLGAMCLLLVDDRGRMWCPIWSGQTTWATGPVRF